MVSIRVPSAEWVKRSVRWNKDVSTYTQAIKLQGLLGLICLRTPLDFIWMSLL
jgi:hypothetical protein